MPYRGNIGSIVVTNNVDVEESSIEWEIQNVLLLSGGNDDCYCSPEFSFGKELWCLRLWPKWLNDSWNPASGWMRLRLLRISGGLSKTFHIKVGIKGSTGLLKTAETEKEFSRFDHYDWDEFCSRFALIEQKSRLMMGDMFTISFVIKMVAPGSAKGTGESSTKRKFLESRVCFPCRKVQGKEEALADFGKLLASEEGSDVTVQVGDVEFRVHRIILSARSPIFSAMFSHETAERASNRIVVEDCEPEVFKEYLQYLYTGTIQSLTEKNVFGLYKVADKYLADNLKQQCLKHIYDILSVQTFYDSVQLAVMYGENGLLEKAIVFASENIYLDSFYFKQNLLL